MDRLVVLGLGRMGLPIAARLTRIAAVVGIDPSEARTDAACAAGVTTSPATMAAREVAACDIVVAVLPGAAVERAALLPRGAEAGLIAGMREGQVLLELTSGDPRLSDDIARAAAARGIRYVAAPMGGGPAQAADGELTFYTAGSLADLERVDPLLRRLAAVDGVIRVGEAPAQAQAAKLLINALWFGQAAMAAETLLLGARLGVAPERLLPILGESAASSSVVRDSLPRVFEGDYLDDFGLAGVVEELDAVAALAGESDAPAELLSLTTALHRRALAELGPVDGELRVVELLERQAGIALRR